MELSQSLYFTWQGNEKLYVSSSIGPFHGNE